MQADLDLRLQADIGLQQAYDCGAEARGRCARVRAGPPSPHLPRVRSTFVAAKAQGRPNQIDARFRSALSVLADGAGGWGAPDGALGHCRMASAFAPAHLFSPRTDSCSLARPLTTLAFGTFTREPSALLGGFEH